MILTDWLDQTFPAWLGLAWAWAWLGRGKVEKKKSIKKSKRAKIGVEIRCSRRLACFYIYKNSGLIYL